MSKGFKILEITLTFLFTIVYVVRNLLENTYKSIISLKSTLKGDVK